MPEIDVATLEDGAPTSSRGLFPLKPHLFVLLECDRPTFGGARYSLSGIDEVVICRSQERVAKRETSGKVTRLFVGLPGSSLSSTHARLNRCGPDWLLEDAGSKNGSFVNGVRVDRATIHDRDLIEVGHTLLSLRTTLPTPPEIRDLDVSGGALTSTLTTLIPELEQSFKDLVTIAESKVPIVLVGDTGTGKEVIARTIHATSQRPGRFVPINCGALPHNLVESQIFGHVKGAFSGAVRDEVGLMRAADRGTILLDEIGDLPLAAQPALLRVLQEGEVVPVGGTRPIAVDVRIMAAAHEPLDNLVRARCFRSDLLGRLEGFVLELPALRERMEDLGVMIASLLRKSLPSAPESIQLKPSVGRALFTYEWPLNVRELEQCLNRALALAQGGPIERRHLPPKLAPVLDGPKCRSPSSTAPPPGLAPAEAALRSELLNKLEQHEGRIADVAASMGKARMQIHRWMKKFAIDPKAFRKPRE